MSHYSCTGNTRTRRHTFSPSIIRRVPSWRSQFLDVPVLLPQDGNLVPEQNRVQPHLGVQQGHETQPVAEDVHAGLSLGEVVRVRPSRCLGALGLERQTWGNQRQGESERGYADDNTDGLLLLLLSLVKRISLPSSHRFPIQTGKIWKCYCVRRRMCFLTLTCCSWLLLLLVLWLRC